MHAAYFAKKIFNAVILDVDPSYKISTFCFGKLSKKIYHCIDVENSIEYNL